MYGYDYSSLGAYFVTICAYEKAHIFGNITNGKMELNWLGKIVSNCLRNLPNHFSGIHIDECVVMPNHVHLIVWIVDRRSLLVGATHASPLHNGLPVHAYEYPKGPPSQSVGSIIGSFKSAVSKHAHTVKPEFNPIWQRNYHERIIRDDGELYAIRKYIRNNPIHWEIDEHALE
ncbi:MAG: transposase [Candidatus Uhrbacteria bacterium]